MVQAQINLSAAPTASDDFIINWSSDSFVPPDYAGKALPTTGSKIRVVVEPTKKLALDPQKLYYRWLLDDGIAGYASGQGKSVFRFQATKGTGGTHHVSVQILDNNENLLALKSQSIDIVKPQLLLTQPGNSYALQNTILVGTGQKIDFSAIPLFFHIKDFAEIIWEWTFANQALSTTEQKDLNMFTLSIPQGKLSETLEKNLSVSAINRQDQFQQDVANITVDIK